MRRLVYAASFVEDADHIAAYIERLFGTRRSDAFIADLTRFCEIVASLPKLGKRSHGYGTMLHGVVHDGNWIFFQYDARETRFVHIVDVRRGKGIVL